MYPILVDCSNLHSTEFSWLQNGQEKVLSSLVFIFFFLMEERLDFFRPILQGQSVNERSLV